MLGVVTGGEACTGTDTGNRAEATVSYTSAMSRWGPEATSHDNGRQDPLGC